MFGWLRGKTVKREIIINSEGVEMRVAVMESGRIEEFQVEHPTEERIVGSIYKGRIQNLEHDLQAAFVDIGLKKNAFLHYWDMMPDNDTLRQIAEGESRQIADGENRYRAKGRKFSNSEIEKRFPPGSEIVVQVTKGPIGSKGPRVTACLSIPGRYLVMMPGSSLKGVSRKIEDGKERQRLKKVLARLPIPEYLGIIVRTVGAGARKTSFVRDLRGLLDIWNTIQQGIKEKTAPVCLHNEPDLAERVVRDWLAEDIDRIVVDDRATFDRIRDIAARMSRRNKSRIRIYEGHAPIFDHYEVERQIEEAFRRKVTLPSGGYLIFDETEALIAIDVNTGKHKGGGSQEDAILGVNIEAVEEVSRQLRLRNIGGLVVVDLIDMKSKRHQSQVYRAMKTALKRDRARTNVLPISDLGLLEMTRQRVEESLLSTMLTDCPYCRGRGHVKSPLSLSIEIQRQLAGVMRKHKTNSTELRLQVVVHPMVLERLRQKDTEFLLDLESEFEGHLSFKSDPSRHVEYYEIKEAESGRVLYSSMNR